MSAILNNGLPTGCGFQLPFYFFSYRVISMYQNLRIMSTRARYKPDKSRESRLRWVSFSPGRPVGQKQTDRVYWLRRRQFRHLWQLLLIMKALYAKKMICKRTSTVWANKVFKHWVRGQSKSWIIKNIGSSTFMG